MLRNALIVVDVQNDFCPGGSLGVAGGDKVAADIYKYVCDNGDAYVYGVATKDWHPDDDSFEHFSTNPNFVTTWPRHCIAGSVGAAFHPALCAWGDDVSESAQWETKTQRPRDLIDFDALFYKGMNSSAYSGFEGFQNAYTPDMIPREIVDFSLEAWLRSHDVSVVDIVGLATDHCVKATALDAARLGFHTTVLLDYTAGVSPETTETAINEMKKAGVVIE